MIEAGGSETIVAYQDEVVFDALIRIFENDIGRMPVVSRDDPSKMVGYLNRTTILSTWTRQMEEEAVREHGWLKKWRQREGAIPTKKAKS